MKPEMLIKGELIGLIAKVVSSSNTANTGLQGRIVDETKNTLVIQTRDGKKRLVKQNCVFELDTGNEKVRIEGKILAKRPEERIRIKLK